MEPNETLRKMRDMRMAGMADAYFRQMADRLVYDQMPFDGRLGMLVDAESDKRLATKLANLARGAKLRFPGARSESVGYALAMPACRRYRSARYCRMPELPNELAAAKAAGRYERVLAKYKKYELLVIDEFMLNVTAKDETRDLYELIEGRSQTHSTVFCSQYQEAGWLERLAAAPRPRASSTAYRTTPTA